MMKTCHIRNQEKHYPKKIRRKLKRAKPTPKIYRYAVFAAVLLFFLGVAKNSFFEKRDETETQQTELEESAARKEINKIYKIQDSQGRTQYTNVAASPDAQLLDEEGKVIRPAVTEKVVVDRVDPGMAENLSTLGTDPRSHKCVRNATSHAKWLYDWVKIGRSAVIAFED